ncbi:hypothetical protein AZA_38742 [Nitrospirillum viridazoti Y2]|nr:hypothetical protein AZA_38742 [Nitrospirillum amazonense Y2]
MQRQAGQGTGQGQAAGIDQAAGEGVLGRQVQRRLAEQTLHGALGRHEGGGAGGVQDVLVRPPAALLIVTVQQGGRRPALDHQGQLPGQVVRVLDATIAAPGAEGGDDMGAVAGEDHPPVPEARQPPALEGVDGGPDQAEGTLTHHGADPGNDALRPHFLRRIGVGTQLQVDAVDVVGLLVQQGGLAAVEGRFEPEPALRREIGLHLHIGDEEAFLEGLAGEVQAQQATHRRPGAVADNQIVRRQVIGAVGRVHPHGHARVRRRDAHHPMAPAQVDQAGEVGAARHQQALHLMLGQVDEGRHAVPVLGQQVEGVDLAGPMEQAPHLPGDAPVHYRPGDAQPVENLQRALGPADGAGAHGQPVIVVQHHGRHAPQCQVDGDRQAHRSGAHDDDRRAPLVPIHSPVPPGAL